MFWLLVSAHPVVPGGKFHHHIAHIHQGLHFRGHIQLMFIIKTVIQGNDADWIACDQVTIGGFVVKHKREHAMQIVQKFTALFQV